MHSSEEQEQAQGKGNAQVEVDKVMDLLYQLFSVTQKDISERPLHAWLHSVFANLNDKKNMIAPIKQRKEMLQPMYVM